MSFSNKNNDTPSDTALCEALQLSKMKVEYSKLALNCFIDGEFPKSVIINSDDSKLSNYIQNELVSTLRMSSLESLLNSLSSSERISLVFLVLPKHTLCTSGYILCQYSTEERVSDIRSHLWQASGGNVDVFLSAFYQLCRYNLLENVLGLCFSHTLHKVCQSLTCLEEDKLTLFRVFASIPQLEANRIVAECLPHWRSPRINSPLEEVFCCNLTALNFGELLREFHEVLVRLQKQRLASLLAPLVTIAEASASASIQETYDLPKSYPHGLCVIINVNSFVKPADPNKSVSLPTRKGSDIDAMRLEGTFKLFGFVTLHIKDPDALTIGTFFANLKNETKLAYMACLVVCVMTHGDAEDRLYLHDRSSIQLSDLRRLCFSPLFINKPRLIFVQACRGNQVLQPMFIARDHFSEGSTAQPINRESDCLISSATVGGYSALRSQSSGSWFISDLCQALQSIGHLQPISGVLQHARRSLNARVDLLGNHCVTQINEDITTLLKQVRLVRGEESSFIEGVYLLILLESLEDLIDETIDTYCECLSENSPEMVKMVQLLQRGY